MGNARLYPYTDRGATPDFYVEHMRKTMAWIHEKIADHRREPSHKGYGVEICVEAQWLEQLVAECLAKHQMLMECQRRLGEIGQAIAWSRPIVAPAPPAPPAAVAENLPEPL